MSELRDIATDLGATEVSTYIASGNLICTPPAAPHDFDRQLESAIEARYGYSREVISRSVDDLTAALDAYPFTSGDPAEANADGADTFAHIYFLAGEPSTENAKTFAEKDFGKDRIELIGSDLHISYADGVAGSKLTSPGIARGLGVQGTGRNLRTIRKLIELAGD